MWVTSGESPPGYSLLSNSVLTTHTSGQSFATKVCRIGDSTHLLFLFYHERVSRSSNTYGEVRMGLKCKGFYPCGDGCTTLLPHGCVHQPRSSPYLRVQGFLWKLHPAGMIHELNPSTQPLSPPQRMEWAGGRQLQVPNHDLDFLVTSPLQEPTQSHFIRTKAALSPGKFPGT